MTRLLNRPCRHEERLSMKVIRSPYILTLAGLLTAFLMTIAGPLSVAALSTAPANTELLPPPTNGNAGGTVSSGANLVAYTRENGTDLNGDGDTTDEDIVAEWTATGGFVPLGFSAQIVGVMDNGTALLRDLSTFEAILITPGAAPVHTGLEVGGDALSDWGMSTGSQIIFNSGSFASSQLGTTVTVIDSGGTIASASARALEHDGAVYYVFPDGRVGFVGPELGGPDYTGDGDTNDTVIHILDPVSGNTLTVPYPVRSDLYGGSAAILESGELLTTVVEAQVGPSGLDLNGDGDANDELPITIDSAGNSQIWPIEINSTSGGGGSANTGSRVWFVNTASHLIRLDTATGNIVDLGETPSYASDTVVEANGRDYFTVHETEINVDMNSDGDLNDWYLVSATSSADRTILATNPGIWAYRVFELSEVDDATDWNQDGDLSDRVMSVLRDDGSILPLPSVVGTNLQARDYDGWSLFWNAEGDAWRFSESGGLEALHPGLSEVPYGRNREAVAAKRSESLVGADLNGDGDTSDLVWVLISRDQELLTNLTADNNWNMIGDRSLEVFVPVVEN
ncbi:MAG TPA: hypothetical protein ENK31_08415, partial [Nannocystis exedens]|nr:hypothetical protein [Nannocystis exedens]